eukprot:2026280-Pyramimonas_sp.AAC.1
MLPKLCNAINEFSILAEASRSVLGVCGGPLGGLLGAPLGAYGCLLGGLLGPPSWGPLGAP